MVSVVLRFDNLSGSHHQSQVICVTSVGGINDVSIVVVVLPEKLLWVMKTSSLESDLLILRHQLNLKHNPQCTLQQEANCLYSAQTMTKVVFAIFHKCNANTQRLQIFFLFKTSSSCFADTLKKIAFSRKKGTSFSLGELYTKIWFEIIM